MKGSPENGRLSSAAFLFVMALGYAVYAADRTVLSSVLLPMSESLRFSNFELGLLGSAQYIGVLAVVALAGNLSDSYGRRNVIILGLALFTLFTWLIGFTDSFYSALLFRFVSGLGEGIFWPVAMAAVADVFGSRKGFALGVFYVGFDIGSTAGLSIGGLAYFLSGAWQDAFFFAPLLGLGSILGVYLLKQLFLERKGGRVAFTPRAAFALLRNRNMSLITIFALLATWASVWQVVFLPFYFSKVWQAGVLYADLLSSLAFVSGALGKVVLGGASDTSSRNRFLLALSGSVVIAYAVFFFSTSFAVAIAASVAMGFLSSAVFPVMQALATDYSPGLEGTGMGLTTTFQSVATVLSPIIAGLLLQLGAGRAIALDAMVPAFLMTGVAMFLRPGQGHPGSSQSL